ncbi:MAG: hypothetical protein JF584_12225 [Acidobacteria bacterium]|nr:hypothetical protein [Acidobacteriota bacterium]
MYRLHLLQQDRSRRSFLKSAFASAVVGCSLPALAVPAKMSSAHARSDLLHGAMEAARWIRAGEMKTSQGKYWLPEPIHPSRELSAVQSRNIRRGSAGILLFLLEMYTATGDATYLEDAVSGARFLSATWPQMLRAPEATPGTRHSFYDGLAGVGFALTETWRISQDTSIKHAADAITGYLSESAIRDSDGVSWSETSSIAGDSSVILYLLYAAQILDDSGYRHVAAQGADRLVSLQDSGNGVHLSELPSRRIQQTDRTYVPNFEYGAAGIAYTLARAYEDTEQADYLQAAREGALRIELVACRQKEGVLIPYCVPAQPAAFQIGFSQGAAGTARLFYQLHKVTADNAFFQMSEKLADGILSALQRPLTTMAPEENALCQHSGKAGVMEFLLGMGKVTRDTRYREAVDRIGQETIQMMDFYGHRSRWYDSYSHVPAPFDTWETGYSFGAAGIGSALLHAAVAGSSDWQPITWPDNPFPLTSRL